MRFISNNQGGTSWKIPAVDITNWAINMIGVNDYSTVAIEGTDDNGGNACPSGNLNNIYYKNLKGGWNSPFGKFCGGLTVVQPADMSTGTNLIRFCTWTAAGCQTVTSNGLSALKAIPGVLTGSKTSQAVIGYVTIPAGAITSTGSLQVNATFTTPVGNSSTCTPYFRLTQNVPTIGSTPSGGTSIVRQASTTGTTAFQTLNLNILNQVPSPSPSQIVSGFWNQAAYYSATVSALSASSSSMGQNMAVQHYGVFSGTLANSADKCVLAGATVTLVP